MKITLAFARLLQSLLQGNSCTQASFTGSGRQMLLQFISDGAIDYIPKGTQQRRVVCHDAKNLRTYLHHKYEIPSLELYIDFLEKENTTRSEAVQATSNSKFRNTKVFDGFLVNCYDDLQGTLNGITLSLKPAAGSFIFIADPSHFSIPSNVTVVGVEGHENFRYISQQCHLFNMITPLFVWRYQNSNSITRWMEGISNPYLHFGDYDPKGLHIYVSEFRNKLGADRCSFFVPQNLEALVFDHGEKRLYDGQMEYLKGFQFNMYPELREAVGIIQKLKKGLAQEILMAY